MLLTALFNIQKQEIVEGSPGYPNPKPIMIAKKY